METQNTIPANCIRCSQPDHVIPKEPSGFVMVSRETFFAVVNPLNINPRSEWAEASAPHSRQVSEWRMLDSSRGAYNRMVGWSWSDTSDAWVPAPKRYALHPELIAEAIRAGVK